MMYTKGQLIEIPIKSFDFIIHFSFYSRYILNQFMKNYDLHLYFHDRDEDCFANIGNIIHIDYKTNVMTVEITKDVEVNIHSAHLIGNYKSIYDTHKDKNSVHEYIIIKRKLRYRFAIKKG